MAKKMTYAMMAKAIKVAGITPEVALERLGVVFDESVLEKRGRRTRLLSEEELAKHRGTFLKMANRIVNGNETCE